MDQPKIKTTITLLAVLFLTGTGATLSLDVNIDEITQYDTVQIEKQEEIEQLQEVNFTLENTGSIGCTFQAGLETNVSGEEQVAWSEPVQLWPGDSHLMEIKELHENQTGTAEATLFLEHCYQTDTLENFTYNIDQELTFEQENQTSETTEVQTITTAATENQANITTEVENATLIPKETPSMWRASATNIENGQTTINYDTQIFDPEETLTYYILENGEITGETTVNLEPERNLVDLFSDYFIELLLIISLILNIALFSRTNLKTKLDHIKP